MKRFLILWSVAVMLPIAGVYAQIYSFESPQTETWRADGAELSYSKEHWKLGATSLRIDWAPGAVVRLGAANGLDRASGSKSGGLAAWIYNERPMEAPLRVVFRDAAGAGVCEVEIRLGFKGWRCIWNRFVEDMGKRPGVRIATAELRFPETETGGTLYLDCLEFTPNVSWQKMSDFQVRVHRTDFSLIPDFMKYRLAEPDPSRRVEATAEQIAMISERLEAWYLGSGEQACDWTVRRQEHEAAFIRRGVALSREYAMTEPLFPMRTPAKIDGEKTRYFMDINKRVLLPLALDYRKNGCSESRDRALRIYDWFSDQGWADGSSLGSLCFEKLRSAGYFHSLFLLRDELPEAVRMRELATLRWMTLFGICYLEPAHPGEVADNLRALALPKLAYALMQPDEVSRQTALTAFRDYMESALGFGPGYFGTFKSDGSGYHHRGAYNSAYYPHALYAGALVAYLLHDTPYALSSATLANLKRGLLTFRFFCADLRVPAGTAGRFPQGQEVLQELLPTFAYAAYSFPEPDAELLAAARRLLERHPAEVEALLDRVDSDLSYTATVGEAEFLARVRTAPVEAEAAPCGALFLPYSGLLTVKDAGFHFNVKGFSRYIWDFESSDTENLSGRYLSNGHLEFFDLHDGARSFHPEQASFDWNLIPGTTSIRLPDGELALKSHRQGYSDHRNFSDESFLAGAATDGGPALFAFRMHSPAYDGDLRADKSYFFLGDAVLCLGSGISSTDAGHPTVTTLFQSCGKGAAGKPRRVAGGSVVTDPDGLTYAVRDAAIGMDVRKPFVRGWIDHGTAPQEASYGYYLIPKRDVGYAARLLSRESPVEILRQDSVAHIVRLRVDGTVCAALYGAGEEYSDLLVRRVNIPLAYILEGSGADRTLTLCEPDMRRPWVRHMGLLTEEQVVVPEQPFATRLLLRGDFEVESPDVDVRVSRTAEGTVVELSTVCGRNYRLELHERR